MTDRSTARRAGRFLLPPLALALTAMLTACSGDDAPAPAPSTSEVGVVHLPTSTAATTDASGRPIEPLPTDLPPARMSADRVRGFDYSYPLPADWKSGEKELNPRPDTLVQPDDDDVPAFIAVERPVEVGSHSLGEAVDELRSDFEAKGWRVKSAPERELAGYDALGLVVDQSPELRHVYYVVVYTQKLFAVRLSYDPAAPEALAVLTGILDGWTWG